MASERTGRHFNPVFTALIMGTMVMLRKQQEHGAAPSRVQISTWPPCECWGAELAA